jgi:FKBP-type peptidyl-prolyl cis-trans isomerase
MNISLSGTFRIWFCFLLSFAEAFSSFLQNESRASIRESNIFNVNRYWNDRRAVLGSLVTTVASLAFQPSPAFASISKPLPQEIIDVVLDSPESRVGLQLSDAVIGSETYAAVKLVLPDGVASQKGVQEGMIILGKDSSKSVVNQIKDGPYPVVLQFYNLAEEMVTKTAVEGLQRAQQTGSKTKETNLSTKGAGLGNKVIHKGDDCSLKVRRGDTVKINFEARVASPGGPIYDSSGERGGPITFTLGEGKAINGVEIGMGGMCAGEIREFDIPAVSFYFSL